MRDTDLPCSIYLDHFVRPPYAGVLWDPSSDSEGIQGFTPGVGDDCVQMKIADLITPCSLFFTNELLL